MLAIQCLKEYNTMNSQNQSNRTTIRNLAIFVIVVLAIGWIGRLLDVLMDNPAPEGLGILLWIVTPLGASVLLRAFAGDRGLGLITFPNFSLNTLGLILQVFALGLLPQFIKNILEEAAWRGYLLPRLFSLRLNDFAGHFIVGLVWGAWHIPYYLFFLDRAILEDFTTLNLAAFIPLSILVMISWAMVYGEIRLLANSIWPAVLMHMVEDAFLNQLFTEHHIQIVPGTDWLVSPVNGLIGILFFIAIGVGLRQLRKRKT
jgi:membrane protease YdiL (CAAX protease family)